MTHVREWLRHAKPLRDAQDKGKGADGGSRGGSVTAGAQRAVSVRSSGVLAEWGSRGLQEEGALWTITQAGVQTEAQLMTSSEKAHCGLST